MFILKNIISDIMPQNKYNLPLQKILEKHLQGMSAKALAQEYNCSYHVMYYHLKHAGAIFPKGKYRDELSIEQKEKLKKNKISPECFRGRINAGWTIEKAVNTPKKGLGLWNRLTKEQKQTMGRNGISKQCFYQRINAGWSIEKTVNTPNQQKKLIRVKSKSSSMKLKNLLIKSNT